MIVVQEVEKLFFSKFNARIDGTAFWKEVENDLAKNTSALNHIIKRNIVDLNNVNLEVTLFFEGKKLQDGSLDFKLKSLNGENIQDINLKPPY